MRVVILKLCRLIHSKVPNGTFENANIFFVFLDDLGNLSQIKVALFNCTTNSCTVEVQVIYVLNSQNLAKN